MNMPKCCSDCDLCYDMIGCSVSGINRGDDWWEIMDKKRIDSCPIIAEIPDITEEMVVEALRGE